MHKWGRDRERERETEREKETQNLKWAPDSEFSVQSPTWGLKPQTVRA